MSVEIQIEPINEWPLPETAPRRQPQFKASYEKTLRLLRYELGQIGAVGAVAVQVVTANGTHDLRRDGMLYARAEILHPGVRVSFESEFGPLTYSSDAFAGRYYNDPPDWQSNLRAIALGLEHLRTLDRYGIAKHGEQYRGWQQIAARTGSSAGMSRDLAMSVLRDESLLPHPELDLTLALRRARKHAHPDRNNGSESRWNAVEEAARALGLLE
jgi:hypothetical protein